MVSIGMKKGLKIAKYAIVSIITAFVIFVGAVCVYTLVRRAVFGDEMPSVFGFTMATVATGSMEPEIEIGDLVIIKSYDSYDDGDVITFYDSAFGGYITHRIIGVNSEGLFITKGDANSVADTSAVAYSQIIGKVIAVWGGAGSVISFLQTPAGIICIIAVLAAIWAISEISGYVIKKIRHKTDDEEGDSE